MSNRKKVLCPIERNGKTRWFNIGSAFINTDGSTNIYLDAYPSNGRLQVRDLDERDKKAASAKAIEASAPAEDSSSAVPF